MHVKREIERERRERERARERERQNIAWSSRRTKSQIARGIREWRQFLKTTYIRKLRHYIAGWITRVVRN
jgi:hypothetical protein